MVVLRRHLNLIFDFCKKRRKIIIAILLPGTLLFSFLFGYYVEFSKEFDDIVKNADRKKPYTGSVVPRPQYKDRFESAYDEIPKEKLSHENPEITVSGRVAYLKDNEVYIINADKTGNRQLTNDGNIKNSLSVSPNSKLIAFAYRPSDEKPYGGMFSYYSVGIGLYNLETSHTSWLQLYSKDSHYTHMNFSPDSRFLASWKDSSESVIYRIADGEKVIHVKPSTEKGRVSPIVFLGDSRISYIVDGRLVVADLNNSKDSKVLATGVDSFRVVHEGPPVPEPPIWSESEKYVMYYKDGDLYLLKTEDGRETLVYKGELSWVTEHTYPNAYPEYISVDEKFAVMLIFGEDATTYIYNLESGEMKEIADFGQSLSTSFDGKIVFGLVMEDWPASSAYYDLTTSELHKCGNPIETSYYTWAGGTNYQSRLITWNPSSTAILATGNLASKKDDVVQILILDKCYLYDLVDDASTAVWVD